MDPDWQQHEAALCINWSEATPSLKCGEYETGRTARPDYLAGIRFHLRRMATICRAYSSRSEGVSEW